MKSFIHAIGTALPKYAYPQQEIGAFMAERLGLSDQKEQELRVLYRATGIQVRHSVLPDFGLQAEALLFRPHEHFPQVGKRMAIYRQEAPLLAKKAIENCFAQNSLHAISEITHLITISCTGMYAPGLDLDLLKMFSLPGSVQRTSINFMGCYAALQGMKAADAICRSTPHAVVAVVCVELCTLHFRESTSPDDLLAGALFADGAAALMVSAKAPTQKCFSIEGFRAEVFPKRRKRYGLGNWRRCFSDAPFYLRAPYYWRRVAPFFGLVEKCPPRATNREFCGASGRQENIAGSTKSLGSPRRCVGAFVPFAENLRQYVIAHHSVCAGPNAEKPCSRYQPTHVGHGLWPRAYLRVGSFIGSKK